MSVKRRPCRRLPMGQGGAEEVAAALGLTDNNKMAPSKEVAGSAAAGAVGAHDRRWRRVGI